MFDASTTRLIERAAGMRKAAIIQSCGIVGWPMVDTRARFLMSVTFGDEVVIDSAITRVGNASFDLEHRLLREGRLCVEGLETRVWTARTIDASIKSVPLPATLADVLRHASRE
jgi:4-hydroxybenzoyl-CoA thioesterase